MKEREFLIWKLERAEKLLGTLGYSLMDSTDYQEKMKKQMREVKKAKKKLEKKLGVDFIK